MSGTHRLRFPCRTDASEIHYFSPFSFNKQHVPQLRCSYTASTVGISRENKTVRSSNQILDFVKVYIVSFPRYICIAMKQIVGSALWIRIITNSLKSQKIYSIGNNKYIYFYIWCAATCVRANTPDTADRLPVLPW